MDTDKVKAFFENAQVQASIRALFGASGVIYQFLFAHGFSADQIMSLQSLLITFGPLIIVWSISMLQKTHAAIIAKAASILASQRSGLIVTAPNAPDTLTAMARDKDTPGIVPANSAEAKAVAAGATPSGT